MNLNNLIQSSPEAVLGFVGVVACCVIPLVASRRRNAADISKTNSETLEKLTNIINKQSEQLVKQDELIAKYRTQLTEREELMAEQRKQISEQDTVIKEQKFQLGLQKEQIERQEKQLRKQDAISQDLTRNNEALKKQVEQLSSVIERLKPKPRTRKKTE